MSCRRVLRDIEDLMGESDEEMRGLVEAALEWILLVMAEGLDEERKECAA